MRCLFVILSCILFLVGFLFLVTRLLLLVCWFLFFRVIVSCSSLLVYVCLLRVPCLFSLLVARCLSFVACSLLSIPCCWLFVVCCLLFDGCCLKFVGCWSLVVGCLLLVVGCCLSFVFVDVLACLAFVCSLLVVD